MLHAVRMPTIRFSIFLFVCAHSSRERRFVTFALVRPAFEPQQKKNSITLFYIR